MIKYNNKKNRKDQFVKKIGISSMCSVQGENTELKFLDVAGGTGDISFRIIDELNKNSAFDHMKENNKNDEKEDEIKDSDNLHALISPKALVTISDINPNMLSVGKNRAYKRFTEPNILEHVAFQEANAEKLPFADERCVSIASTRYPCCYIYISYIHTHLSLTSITLSNTLSLSNTFLVFI